MPTFLRKHIFRSYYQLTGRTHVLSDVDALETRFHASRTEIEANARERMAELLRRALRDVPFYRNSIDPGAVQAENALEVLAQFPPLTKAKIRAEGSKLHSTRPGPKPRWNTSGGSTGEPVRLRQDRDMGQESRTGELLYLRWAGHEPGDPHLLIWGVPQSTYSRPVPIRERIFRFACNETYLNCYGINDGVLGEWVQTINRLRPAVIEAYVDAAHELSRYILERKLKTHRPRGIIVSAGVLTPHARSRIAEAFGAPILNRYGSREVGNVACSCGQSEPMHVNEGWCHVEIVDDAGRACEAGREGNVLVTVFANHTMPLIRYQIEDRAIWSDAACPCGRKTRMLESVTGRMNDYLSLPDGGKISGAALTATLIHTTRGIRQYQFRQTTRDQVVLAVAAMPGYSVEELTANLQAPVQRMERMLAGMRVNVVIEEQIAPSGSGKFRYVINEISRQDPTTG